MLHNHGAPLISKKKKLSLSSVGVIRKMPPATKFKLAVVECLIVFLVLAPKRKTYRLLR